MQRSFRVSDWDVEPQLNSLTGPERTAHLEPKVMQVLVYLAEHAGQIVAKDRLLQQVWPDTFVSDDVLTRSISELRRAFGDDAREPRFIQTIPRGGYRLIAIVSASPAHGAAPGQTIPIQELETTPVPRRRKSVLHGELVAVALVILIVVLALVWWQSPAPSPEITERKLTGNSPENSVTSMAVSRDGSYLAYADNTG